MDTVCWNSMMLPSLEKFKYHLCNKIIWKFGFDFRGVCKEGNYFFTYVFLYHLYSPLNDVTFGKLMDQVSVSSGYGCLGC